MRNLALVPSLIAAMALAGCGHFFDRAKKPPEHRPETTGAGMAPPAGARTADEFDRETGKPTAARNNARPNTTFLFAEPVADLFSMGISRSSK